MLDDIEDFEEVDAEKDDEPELCGACNGSGEGMYEGTRCPNCRGKGTVSGNE